MISRHVISDFLAGGSGFRHDSRAYTITVTGTSGATTASWHGQPYSAVDRMIASSSGWIDGRNTCGPNDFAPQLVVK